MADIPAASAGIVLVTGIASGIGRELAGALAAAGATVGIVAGDPAQGQEVRDQIASSTARTDVRLFVADLTRQADIRALAAEVQTTLPRLDALVHSSAVFTPRRTFTADGLETMFASNHLAPFLLTSLLRDLLMESAPARVLTLATPLTEPLDFDDLQCERQYRALTAFARSKTANLLFTFELARRLQGTGVTANAVHPGMAPTRFRRWAATPLRWASWLFSKSPAQAAADIVPLVLSAKYDGVNGRFFQAGREIDAPPYLRDREIGRRLWEASEALIRDADAGRGPTA